MNKDFLKPVLIIAVAAILTGVVAWVLPVWNNDVFTIRKMPWFSALLNSDKDTDPPAAQQKKIADTPSPLRPFLNKLGAMKPLTGKTAFIEETSGSAPRKLRIAYFSDSIIEGDLITAPLRSTLQDIYGGTGVGMMPITSIVSGFKQTIRHEFSRNWETISFMTRDKGDVSLGITGYTFIPRSYYMEQKKIETDSSDNIESPDSLFVSDSLATAPAKPVETRIAKFYVQDDPWVEYRAVDIAGGAAYFEGIKLYYSHATDSSIVRISYDSAPPVTRQLKAGNSLQALNISPGTPIKRIRLSFSNKDPLHLYGLSFDEDRGIYVDNFPIRGYSGMYFQRIHAEILRAFNQNLNYDLVVLQYGENVSNPKNTDYENYKRAMIRTIEYIQTAMPKVPILIVSAHDRSIKVGTKYQTSPDIPILVKTQSEFAKETGCAFWNLYEAMGGYNSMLGLVNQNPPLAGKDYTHFTRRGADYVAELLLKFLKGES
jgi:lysophospholipase L1-like esterase